MTYLIQAKWTDKIHDEWIRSVLKNRSELKKFQQERTRRLMNENTRDFLVEGYESLIPTLSLPYSDDCHVVVVAIHAEAPPLVTFNLKDFPARILKSKCIKAQHPDDFILHLMDIDIEPVREATESQRAELRNSPISLTDFLATLEN